MSRLDALQGASSGSPGAPLKAAGAAALALAAFLLPALLVGCASAPTSGPTEPQTRKATGSDRAPGLISDARSALDEATPSFLKHAATLLSSSELSDTPDAARLAAAGKALFARLFPELPSPFPDEVTPADIADMGVTPFLAAIAPSLVLLDPPAGPVPKDQATQFEASLAAAQVRKSGSALVAYLQAVLLERTGGDQSKVLAGYEESLRRTPAFYPAAARAAAILLAQGRAPQELPRLLALAAALPTDAMRFLAIARAQLAAGNPEQAADAAARAMLADPRDPSPALLRAQALAQEGNWYQALRVLDVLLKLKPGLPDALLARIQILHQDARDDEQANDVLQQALTDYPQDVRFVELQGRMLLDEGDADQAFEVLRKAAGMDAANTAVLALVATAASRAGAWQDASRWFSQIPIGELTPERLRLGWQIATMVGRHEQALGFAQELLADAPSDEPWLLQARSLASLGSAQEALAAVAEGLRKVQDPSIRSRLLVVKASLEPPSSDQAIDDLRSALREDPDDSEALTAIAAALRDREDYRKALEYLRHAADLDPEDATLARGVTDLEELAATQE